MYWTKVFYKNDVDNQGLLRAFGYADINEATTKAKEIAYNMRKSMYTSVCDENDKTIAEYKM